MSGEFDEKAGSLIAEAAARAAAVMKKGDKGDKGDTGAMGLPGRDGRDAPSIISGSAAAGAVLSVDPSAMSTVAIDPSVASTSGRITIDPSRIGSGIFVHPSGAITASANPPKPKPQELVLLPTKRPKKVLVAFIDEEEGTEPYWAAYLEPQDMDIALPEDIEDATMTLYLRLRKRFEQ